MGKRGANVVRRDTAMHVALVKEGGSNASIIEATRGVGVRQIPLPQFMGNCSSRCKFYHGKVQGVTHEQARRAVAFAESKLDFRYAEEYLAPTPNVEEYYCSSLIDHAYCDVLGKSLVFTDEPFQLIFEPRQFWDRYYAERNKNLPICVGSNPTLLLHSLRVKYYETAFGRFSSSRDTLNIIDLNCDLAQYALAIEHLSSFGAEAVDEQHAHA